MNAAAILHDASSVPARLQRSWPGRVAVKPNSKPSAAVLDKAEGLAQLVEQTFLDVHGEVEGMCGPASRILLALLAAEGIPSLLAFDGDHVWLMIGDHRVDPTIAQFDDRAPLVQRYKDPCWYEAYHYRSWPQLRRELARDYGEYGSTLMEQVYTRLLGPAFTRRLDRDRAHLARLPETALNLTDALDDPEGYVIRGGRLSDLPELIEI